VKEREREREKERERKNKREKRKKEKKVRQTVRQIMCKRVERRNQSASKEEALMRAARNPIIIPDKLADRGLGRDFVSEEIISRIRNAYPLKIRFLESSQ